MPSCKSAAASPTTGRTENPNPLPSFRTHPRKLLPLLCDIHTSLISLLRRRRRHRVSILPPPPFIMPSKPHRTLHAELYARFPSLYPAYTRNRTLFVPNVAFYQRFHEYSMCIFVADIIQATRRGKRTAERRHKARENKEEKKVIGQQGVDAER